MSGKRFRIPNEDVRLTEDEIAITQTITFQRLFFMKQLGLAYLVYPFATHTRGGHSIQCLNEAEKIIKSLCEKEQEISEGDRIEPKMSEKDTSQEEISDKDKEIVRVAALLHDIGHIPFSHTLEDEHEVFEDKHDKKERLDKVLRLLKEEVEDKQKDLIGNATPILNAISDKNKKRDWKSDLVGNTVCADLLAYITTDAEWTGIVKRPGYYRIYEYFKRKNNRLCISLTKGGLRTDIVSAIIDLLDMRYALTERVVFHHAKCVASAMLARSARLCNLKYDDKFLKMGDESFLDYIEEFASKDKGAVELIKSLRSRRLFKRIFKVNRDSREQWERSNSTKFYEKWRKSENVESLLRKIEDKFNLNHGALVLWCPEGQSGMKLVNANVIWEQSNNSWSEPIAMRDEKVKAQFPGVGSRIKTIEEQYKDLWTFWIALNPEYNSKARSIIDSLEEELNIKCDPVFFDSYPVKHIDGFDKSSIIFDNVDEIMKNIKHRVTSKIDRISARENSYVDKNIIYNEINSAIEEFKVNESVTQRKDYLNQKKLFK